MELGDLTSKERILRVAAQVFAEKGYDGARVDEIAKRASVNKALIYYYYDSKEALLELLFEETRDAVLELLSSDSFFSFASGSLEAVGRMMYAVLDLLEERQNVIRLVVMEFAKRTPINDRIFMIVEEIMARMFEAAEKVGLKIEADRPKAMVTEFFTGIMPLRGYVTYHELWMERFGVGEAELRKNFVEAFIGTHFAYTGHAILNGRSER